MYDVRWLPGKKNLKLNVPLLRERLDEGGFDRGGRSASGKARSYYACCLLPESHSETPDRLSYSSSSDHAIDLLVLRISQRWRYRH